MPFVKKHAKIIKKVGTPNTNYMWLRSIMLGLVIFFLVELYYRFSGGHFSLAFLNQVSAATGVIMIGISFALSAICYFWDFFDTKIVYRKYIGLTGFFFILFHFLISFSFYFFLDTGSDPRFDIFANWSVGPVVINNFIAFMLGLIGFLIFLMMALISNKYTAVQLGGKKWRQLLRLGYFALAFGLIHFFIKKIVVWKIWIAGDFGLLPPFSLLLFFYVLIVLGLRLALEISIRKKKKKSKKPKKSKK